MRVELPLLWAARSLARSLKHIAMGGIYNAVGAIIIMLQRPAAVAQPLRRHAQHMPVVRLPPPPKREEAAQKFLQLQLEISRRKMATQTQHKVLSHCKHCRKFSWLRDVALNQFDCSTGVFLLGKFCFNWNIQLNNKLCLLARRHLRLIGCLVSACQFQHVAAAAVARVH